MKKIFLMTVCAGLMLGMSASAQVEDRMMMGGQEMVAGSGEQMEMPVSPDGGMGMPEDMMRTPEATCELNGRIVPCEEVMEAMGGMIETGFQVVIALLVVAFLVLIFWLWMFIHAIKSSIENKVIWIICFVIFGAVTAIIYYFVVYRGYAPQVASTTPPPVPPLPPTP